MTVPMPSFYDPVPDRADDLFEAYRAFLEERNGPLDGDAAFATRDRRMVDFDDVAADHAGAIDAATFEAGWHGRADRDAPEALLALLAFVKLNASEAYGVEVTGRARAKLYASADLAYRVERTLHREEHYHTRLLVGAAKHYGLDVEGAWSPPWPLQLLIFALAKAPPQAFHPILLASEISGIYIFNWMLNRVGTAFRDTPDVRDSLEERLTEVLIDEVGHVAYNRLRTPAAAFAVVRPLSGAVLASTRTTVPEAVALGLDAEARAGLDGFDFSHLPEEVRRRAFFA